MSVAVTLRAGLGNSSQVASPAPYVAVLERCPPPTPRSPPSALLPITNMALFASRPARKSGPLERLGKVVVIEDVLDAKAGIENASSPAELLVHLKKLDRFYMSYESLRDTQVGVVVRRLQKHENADVAAVAQALVRTSSGLLSGRMANWCWWAWVRGRSV
jgi:hypothetical protein